MTYKHSFGGDVLQRCSTNWNRINRFATDAQRKATNRHDLEPYKTMQNEFKLHYNKTLSYARLWCSSFEIDDHYHISVMIMRFTAKSWLCDLGFREIHSIVATEWWPFCLGLNALNILFGLKCVKHKGLPSPSRIDLYIYTSLYYQPLHGKMILKYKPQFPFSLISSSLDSILW